MQTPFRNSLMASGALPAGRQAVVKIGRRKTKKKDTIGEIPDGVYVFNGAGGGT